MRAGADLFPLPGYVAQQFGHDPARGIRCQFIGQFQPAGADDLVDRATGFDLEPVRSRTHDERRLAVEFILNRAYQFFQYVLQRDHPGNRTELVHQHGQYGVTPLEFQEQCVEADGLGQEQRRTGDTFKGGELVFVVKTLHEVLDVNDPDDLVQVLVTQREARVSGFGHDTQFFLGGIILVHEHDLVAGKHVAPGDLLFEIEHVLHDPAFPPGNVPPGHHADQGNAQFRFSERFAVRVYHPDAQAPEHEIRAYVQQPDERSKQPVEQDEGNADDQRHLPVLLQCDELGNELAGRDEEEGHYYECERDRDDVGGRCGKTQGQHERFKERGHGPFAEPAQTQATERYPQLARGKIGIQVLQDIPYSLRDSAAILDHDLDLCHPDLDQGEFRGYEEAVECDQ